MTMESIFLLLLAVLALSQVLYMAWCCIKQKHTFIIQTTDHTYGL